MTGQLDDRLAERASKAGVIIEAHAGPQLEEYLRLLALWNRKINLTALPLQPPTDDALDRLIIEPLAAAQFADAPQAWVDLGSGGGSPAIPLKIVHSSADLTMVEATGKKAAFLREVIRVLHLPKTVVRNERFETLSGADKQSDLITVRAVKSGPVLFDALYRLLAPNGRAFLFHSPEAEVLAPQEAFSTVKTIRLGTSGDSRLTILKTLFRNNIVD